MFHCPLKLNKILKNKVIEASALPSLTDYGTEGKPTVLSWGQSNHLEKSMWQGTEASWEQPEWTFPTMPLGTGSFSPSPAFCAGSWAGPDGPSKRYKQVAQTSITCSPFAPATLHQLTLMAIYGRASLMIHWWRRKKHKLGSWLVCEGTRQKYTVTLRLPPGSALKTRMRRIPSNEWLRWCTWSSTGLDGEYMSSIYYLYTHSSAVTNGLVSWSEVWKEKHGKIIIKGDLR